MKSRFLFVFGCSGQWLAAVVAFAGIFIELCFRAHIGYILITLGSFLFAFFTKLRYYSMKNVFRKF